MVDVAVYKSMFYVTTAFKIHLFYKLSFFGLLKNNRNHKYINSSMNPKHFIRTDSTKINRLGHNIRMY